MADLTLDDTDAMMVVAMIEMEQLGWIVIGEDSYTVTALGRSFGLAETGRSGAPLSGGVIDTINGAVEKAWTTDFGLLLEQVAAE